MSGCIHHLDEQAVLGVLVGLDHNGTLGILRMQAFDVGSNRADIHLTTIDPDLVVVGDRDEDIAAFLDRGRGGVGSVDINAGLKELSGH